MSILVSGAQTIGPKDYGRWSPNGAQLKFGCFMRILAFPLGIFCTYGWKQLLIPLDLLIDYIDGVLIDSSLLGIV